MSPNINSEHEALNLGRSDSGDSYGSAIIDVGVGVSASGGHQSNNDHQQEDVSNSFRSVNIFQRRNKCHALSLLAIIAALCAGVRWLASDTFSFRGHKNGGVSAELPDDDTIDRDVDNSYIPNVIWSDEFDGDTLDLTKWTFVNGNGCDVGLCGWGNNELEWYTPSNAHVSQGKLVLTAQKYVTGNSSTYTSSKIITRGKADFGVVQANIDEGEKLSKNELEISRRFEARMKLPWGQGIWPAFWMLPTLSTYGGWPKSGEIDIMENIGKEGPNTVHGTVHYGLEWPQHQYSESGITLSLSKSSAFPPSMHNVGNLNETFHTYAVERLPGIIRWYIDDIEYSSVTKEDMIPYHWPFDEDFYFILNLAVGGNWPGYPDEDDSDGDASLFPQQLEVDYVRVYEDAFPRIIGKSVVDCSERDVVYEIVNIEAKELSFTWVAPQHATIKEGQGTSRIVVDFDSSKMESNMVDSEAIHVQANRISSHNISTSIGLSKFAKNGIGLRVKIVDFDGKCSTANNAKLGLRRFNFDCGRPLTCTPCVLHKTTDEYTCGERIEWLINEMGMDEKEACKEIAYKQFHGHCGPCNPVV